MESIFLLFFDITGQTSLYKTEQMWKNHHNTALTAQYWNTAPAMRTVTHVQQYANVYPIRHRKVQELQYLELLSYHYNIDYQGSKLSNNPYNTCCTKKNAPRVSLCSRLTHQEQRVQWSWRQCRRPDIWIWEKYLWLILAIVILYQRTWSCIGKLM